MDDDQVIKTYQAFKKLIGRGNGSLTIHFAGGKPQKIRSELDGDAIRTASLKIS